MPTGCSAKITVTVEGSLKILELLIQAVNEWTVSDAEVIVKFANGSCFCGIRYLNSPNVLHGTYDAKLEIAVKVCAEKWLKQTQCNSKWMQLNQLIHGGKL